MANKRPGNQENVPAKKQKTNIDDLWDEELDISVIDDCFKLVENFEQDDLRCTQINNVSILPSYSAFKNLPHNGSVTSTQSEFFKQSTSKPGNSRFPRNNSTPTESINTNSYKISTKNEQDQLQQLKETLRTKEGEVSILRSQIKQSRSHFDTERAKREKEWGEKMNLVEKELGSVKSDLDFKNLEITHLKEKILLFTKLTNQEQRASFTQSTVSRPNNSTCEVVSKTFKTEVELSSMQDLRIQPILEERIPLKSSVPPQIFNLPREKIKRGNPEHFVTTLQSIFPEIEGLMKLSANKLQSNESFLLISKVLSSSLQILHVFLDHLKHITENVRSDELTRSDIAHVDGKSVICYKREMIFNGKEICPGEIGISARQSIAFLSELLMYSSYLQDYVIENKHLEALSNDFKMFVNESNDETKYLEILLKCVTIIGKVKKSLCCVGFLCATTKFLTSIYTSCSNVSRNDTIFLLLKEIIFAKPTLEVYIEISYLLKAMSKDTALLNKLCDKISPKNIAKDGILNCTSHTCVFNILSVLYENILDSNISKNEIQMYENLLNFCHNALSLELLWLSNTTNKSCNCVQLFNTFTLKVICKFLDICVSESKIECTKILPKRYSNALYMCVKVLHVLNFKMMMWIEKYMCRCTLYEKAIYTILQLRDKANLTENDVKQLEMLQVFDDKSATPEQFNCILCANVDLSQMDIEDRVKKNVTADGHIECNRLKDTSKNKLEHQIKDTCKSVDITFKK